MQERPWSISQLRRLGDSLRDESVPDDSLPSYSDVMLWYNDLATDVQQTIRGLDWSPILGERTPSISSRAKTIDTLRQKLVRDPNTKLPAIQDVAGVRFEAEMSLGEQDAVVGEIAREFGLTDSNKIRDLRAEPHSGYRAVHLWLNIPNRGRVEVQVRTHLQSAWANLYELLADIAGRAIRYGDAPSVPQAVPVVASMHEFSVAIADYEQHRSMLASLGVETSAVHEVLSKAEVQVKDAFGPLEAMLRAIQRSGSR